MSASNPPTYVVSIYNPSFFTTSTTGLTVGQANSLYLSKTVADTASGIETFTSGTKSSNYDVVTPSSVMLIGTSQTSSFMAIGCADSRSGNITLASGATQSANVNLCIGATNTGAVHIADGGTNSGAVNICNGATNSGIVHISDGANNSGAVNIANATTNTGAIHIGDNGLGATGAITIGSSTMPTTIGGSFTMGGSNNITLGNGTVAPTLGQIGYQQFGGTITTTIPVNTITQISSITLTTAGMYYFQSNVTFQSVSSYNSTSISSSTTVNNSNCQTQLASSGICNPYHNNSTIFRVTASQVINLLANSNVAQTIQALYFQATRIA